VGDICVLTGALSWSIYIYRMSCIGAVFDEVRLQGWKTVHLATLYSLWCLAAVLHNHLVGHDATSEPSALWAGWRNPIAWLLILYSAAFPGTIADIVQQKGQAVIGAAESNVILSMEPVFTAVLGWCFLGEATTLLENLGGLVIIVAALVATL